MGDAAYNVMFSSASSENHSGMDLVLYSQQTTGRVGLDVLLGLREDDMELEQKILFAFVASLE
jgi:hypothetical protein